MRRRYSRYAAFVVALGGLILYSASSGLGDPPDPGVPGHIHGSLFTPGFSLRHSSPDSIVIAFSVSDLRLDPRSVRGVPGYQLSLPGGECLGMSGAPDLPVYRKLVAVPDGGAVTVTTRVRTETVVRHVTVADFERAPDEPASRNGMTREMPVPGAPYPHRVASVE